LQERCENPALFVDGLLQLKDRFDHVIKNSFAEDKTFLHALSLAFESFVNLEPRSAEFLSLFIDEKLKKGLKGRGDDEMDALLDKVMILFRLVPPLFFDSIATFMCVCSSCCVLINLFFLYDCQISSRS
jgi:hypothetical protein